MMQPIKIIIADDHVIFREGLKLLVRKLKTSEISLIGEAGNGIELLSLLENTMPDIILTDIQMPVMDGIEVTRIITSKFPNVGIIALSTFNDENLVMDMLEAGARGYMLKNTTKEDLLVAIRKVSMGGIYYSSETFVHLTKKTKSDEFVRSDKRMRDRLTEKELSIIKHLCNALSNKEIAVIENLSKRTVESHRENIMEKINGKNVIDLMSFAIKNNIHKI